MDEWLFISKGLSPVIMTACIRHHSNTARAGTVSEYTPLGVGHWSHTQQETGTLKNTGMCRLGSHMQMAGGSWVVA